jgi:hypothetical protein
MVQFASCAATARVAALAPPSPHRTPDEGTLLGEDYLDLPVLLLLHVHEGAAEPALVFLHRVRNSTIA